MRRPGRTLGILLLAVGAGWASAATAQAPSDAPGFAVHIDDRLIDRSVGSTFVRQGRDVRVAASDLPSDAQMLMDSAGLASHRLEDQDWRIQAPSAPGIYPITLHNQASGHTRRLNLFVMQHFDPSERAINGYRIGHYQPQPLHDREVYEPPRALMPVAKDDTDARLSPHFTIGQFLCHQQPGHWPKYLRLRSKLVAKLEAIVAALNRRGIAAQTLTVMSGYRTPQYNAAIGNTTTYSRHLFGGAADIYVDTNGDGRMDDLNGDGTVDVADARWLARLIDSLGEAEPRFVGGLSAYSANSAHGPFVHTDVRGVAARW